MNMVEKRVLESTLDNLKGSTDLRVTLTRFAWDFDGLNSNLISHKRVKIDSIFTGNKNIVVVSNPHYVLVLTKPDVKFDNVKHVSEIKIPSGFLDDWLTIVQSRTEVYFLKWVWDDVIVYVPNNEFDESGKYFGSPVCIDDESKVDGIVLEDFRSDISFE